MASIRSEKGKQKGSTQRLRPIIKPWAQQYRRHRGEWPVFSEIREGINLLYGDGTIVAQNRSSITKFMSELRAHEREVGEEAYMPASIAKIALPTKALRAPKDKSEAEHSLRTRLDEARILADMCAAQAHEGNPDFHAYTKLIATEVSIAKDYDALKQKQLTAEKSLAEQRADLTAFLGTV